MGVGAIPTQAIVCYNITKLHIKGGFTKVRLRVGQMYINEEEFVFIAKIENESVETIVMAEDGYNHTETLTCDELEETLKEYNWVLVNSKMA